MQTIEELQLENSELKALIVRKDKALTIALDIAWQVRDQFTFGNNNYETIHAALHSPTISSSLVEDKEIVDYIEKLDKTTNLGIFYVGVRPPLRGGGMEGGKSVREIINAARNSSNPN